MLSMLGLISIGKPDYKITERYMKKGQKLLFPEIEVDTYWCTLTKLAAKEVIDLYHDHGTSEQFHSKLKSDMDIECLPIGSFSSNRLVLHLGLLAYNMLRGIGQISLEKQQMPRADFHLEFESSKAMYNRSLFVLLYL